MIDLKEILSMMIMLLQEREDEYQRVGWNIKNKINCPIRILYAKNMSKKMRHWMMDLLRGKRIKFTMYGEDDIFHYCDPEEGILLGEDDVEEVEQIPIDILMDYLESKYQHEDVLT